MFRIQQIMHFLYIYILPISYTEKLWRAMSLSYSSGNVPNWNNCILGFGFPLVIIKTTQIAQKALDNFNIRAVWRKTTKTLERSIHFILRFEILTVCVYWHSYHSVKNWLCGMNCIKSNRIIIAVSNTMKRRNQHGDHAVIIFNDDMQNLFDMTSHVNPQLHFWPKFGVVINLNFSKENQIINT